MDPQTPTFSPNNPSDNGNNVVIGGSSEPTPQMPVTPTPPVVGNGGSKKKWLMWLVVVVIIAGGAIGGYLAYKNNHDKNQKKDDQHQQQDLQNAVTKPDYGNIKVGSFRYVNACQAMSYHDQYTLFAGISQVSLLTAKYAENSLPTQDMNDGVESTCSRVFGSDTPYADTTMTFSIKQYPTAADAKKEYDTLNVSQTELDKGNQQFGTNLTTNTVPLTGAANSIYNPDIDASYTLVDNKILSFSAILGDGVSQDKFKQDIVHALPTIITHAQDPKLNQQLNQDPDFGKKIGDSTFMQACQFFTDGDFKTMTGGPNNPMDVEFSYNYKSPTIFFKDNSSGDANDSCTRASYPGTKKWQSVELEVEYFKSASEANQAVQAHMATITAHGGSLGTVQPVSDVGSYAAYIQPTDGDISYFYVQKGPYALKFHTDLGSGWGSKKYPTAADYTKQANVLLPKLK